MTIQERKAQYEQQFSEAEQHVANINNELQKALLRREQIRGMYLAMETLEAEEVPAGSPATHDSN